MKRSIRVLLAVLPLWVAVSLFAPAPALCGDDEGHRGLGLGVFLGYSKAEDAEDGVFLLGGDLSIRILDNRLGGKLEVGYRKDELEDGGSVKSIPILLSVQVLPLGNFVVSPFVIGGGGWWFQLFENIDTGEGTLDEGSEGSFGWHLGAGVDVNLGSWITLTGDIRWVWLDTEFKDLVNQDSSGIWFTTGVKLFL